MSTGDDKTDSSAEKQAKLFKAFVQNRRILIVDSQAYSRAILSQTFVDLGVPMARIGLAASFGEGEQMIREKFPDIVVCEYDLEAGRCGLDLLQTQRAANKEAKKSLFLLVTGNSSQAAVARAAEEDVDGYILKPYTLDGLRMSLMKFAVAKAYPSDYTKCIEQGKAEMEAKEFDKAMLSFARATNLEKKPSLAHFYRGQVEILKKAPAPAEADYNKGLSFNQIHYKCLVGMFELHVSQNRNKEAYEIVRQISKFFPANPERLSMVLRLAIMNKAYDDIDAYYKLFCKLEQRNGDLIRYVCAALVVCGKYYLQNKQKARAVEIFTKAKATGARQPRILREIILSLVQVNMFDEAAVFLESYPVELTGSNDYQALKYIVSERSAPLGVSIQTGRELLKNGIVEFLVYKILIERSLQANFSDHAGTLLEEALRVFPDKRAELEYVFKNPEKRAA